VTYQSIMVHLDLEQANESALRITCDLADRFKSRVIGITAGFPNMPVHSRGMIRSSALEADYKELKQAIARCESRFRKALESIGNSSEWRFGRRLSGRLSRNGSSRGGLADCRPA
jgi:hypothetical protein